MGHATTIRDNLLELEQAAQRLTQLPPDELQPAPSIIDNENGRARPLRVLLPTLLPEGQRSAADTGMGR
jgi:hypothetical protein